MPNSKKPRKRRTRILISHGLSSGYIAALRDKFRDAATRILITLPAGEANEQDILNIREMIGTVQVALATRDSFSGKDIAWGADVMLKAGHHLGGIFDRYEKIGKFVLKGEELTDIREAISVASDFIDDSIQTCPFTFCCEYLVSLRVMVDPRIRFGTAKTFTVAKLKRMIEVEREHFSNARWNAAVQSGTYNPLKQS